MPFSSFSHGPQAATKYARPAHDHLYDWVGVDHLLPKFANHIEGLRVHLQREILENF